MKKIIFLLLFFPLSIFAQVKISALTTTTVVATGDWLLKNNAAGTQTRKIKLGVMLSQYDSTIKARSFEVGSVGGDGFLFLKTQTTGLSAPVGGLKVSSNNGDLFSVLSPSGYTWNVGADALTTNRQFNLPDATGIFTLNTHTQTITNKTFSVCTTTNEAVGDSSAKVASTLYVDRKEDYFTIPFIFSGNLSPLDNTTYYFGGAFMSPTTTATEIDWIGFPFDFSVVGAQVNVFTNTTQGSNESVYFYLRDVTSGTSIPLDTITTDATATTSLTFISSVSGTVVSANSLIAAEIRTLTYATNPVAVRFGGYFICIRRTGGDK